MKPHLIQKASFFNINSPLLAFSKDIYSSGGEDGIIERIFQLIQPEHNFCVEFGALDGKTMSNSCNLIESKGWCCLFIEADISKFDRLLANYQNNSGVICLNEFVHFEGTNSLDNILQAHSVPYNFDLITIDIDGADYFIWESLVSFRPKIVIIEFNPTIPNDMIFVQSRDIRVNQGSSLLALILLGKRKGYELICCTGHNAIFCDNSLYSDFEIPSNLIWNMYKPAMDGRIFHGFDSTIHVHGMDYLMWSRIGLCNEDFQIVPKSLRKLGGYPIS